MVCGGVILVHDYFQDAIVSHKDYGFQGVRKAIDEYCRQHKIMAMPIADEMSIAIMKL
jgi:hypothetical protein